MLAGFLVDYGAWWRSSPDQNDFAFLKLSFQENVLVNDAVPAPTKYKNKWAVSSFAEWRRLREVQVPVLDCGGLFKDYDLHKVTALSADIAGMDALSLGS